MGRPEFEHAMTDPLSIYLSDHLAGAKFAIELLERMRDNHENASINELAEKLLKEVIADCAVLQELLKDIGGGGDLLKKAGAWLAERTAQLKLRIGNDAELGDFEALEVLALGILGKLKLWTALSVLASSEPRLRRLDLQQLIERAQLQHDEVERYRLAAVTKALIPHDRP
jgi:hypothetical protein